MRPAQLQKEPGRWDERDLIRRLCHALDIAKLAVEQLAPMGYTNAKAPAKNVRPEKILSETAVLLLHASSVATDPEVRMRIMRLAEHLIPYARSERMLLGLCLEPSVAWDYALPHVCLNRLGYYDSQFDELLRQTVESQAHAGRERVPHRMLEQEWVAMGWHRAKRTRGSTTPRTARISILNHSMDLFGGTRDDIYAFTHALMYVTDFNLHPAPLPRRRSIILTEAEAVLSRCLDDQDYDLGGEVLLSWPLTGKSWSAAAAFAFRVLAHVEDKAGFLPTPGTCISELNALEGTERTQYFVATVYHTAYVMGLVCAASLHRGFAPPASIPTTNAKRGSARQILKLIDLDRQHTHWRDEFQQLGEPEADALAGYLINIGLRRRMAGRDFGGLRELLKLAYDLDVANIPAASQAAEMLERITTFAKIVSNSQREIAQEVGSRNTEAVAVCNHSSLPLQSSANGSWAQVSREGKLEEATSSSEGAYL